VESKIEANSNIFRFLDSILEKRRKEVYSELSRLSEDSVDYFYIFSMLIYLLRNITYAKYQTAQFSKLKDFQKSKYKAFSDRLPPYELQKVYSSFVNLNCQCVTGEIGPDLMVSLGIERLLAV
jgi:DNA polymerase III delta subunit